MGHMDREINPDNERQLAELEIKLRYGCTHHRTAARCPTCGSRNHKYRDADKVCLHCCVFSKHHGGEDG
jgi:hypothetical protein